MATSAKDKDGSALSSQVLSSFATLRRLTLSLSPHSNAYGSTYGFAVGNGPLLCPTADGNLKVGYHTSVASSGDYEAFARFDLTALGSSSDIVTLEGATFSAEQVADAGSYYSSGHSVGIALMAPGYITFDIVNLPQGSNLGTFTSSTAANPSFDVLSGANQQWLAGGTSALLFQLFKQGTFTATMNAQFKCTGMKLVVQYLTR